VLARIFSTHSNEFASLTWEWIIRADGQVGYRLTELRGRRERNPWRSVTRLSGVDLRSFSQDAVSAEAWLASPSSVGTMSTATAPTVIMSGVADGN
jgi:hypothetical protein